VSGVVSETTSQGARPLDGVSVSAWIQQATFGYSYMWANGGLKTDAAGRYRLSGLAGGATARVQVWKDGYVQQCAAPMVTLNGDININVDVQLVSRANLSASSASLPPPAAGTRSVSGVIFEMTAAGRQPIADAFVDFEPVMDFPAAITYSDASGRYLLCGLPDGQAVDIGAGSNRRVAYVSVPPGQSTGVDIELK
jgi:hypothetical protein